MHVVGAVGGVTAISAAMIGLVMTDIKRVLAYSTISQLGFMFAALGVGAWAIALFHLVTHAAFKALLFLTAGSVIHGADTQDLRQMGGLRKAMPVTFVVWLIGIGALVGLPPLAGFFSKDLVIDAVWAGQPVAGAALFLTVFVTGLYSARATRLAFFGAARGHGHAHESPRVMLTPLLVLAVPAALAGLSGGWLLTRLGEPAETLSLPLSVLAVALALAGVAVGWFLEAGQHADETLEARTGPAWRMSASGLGFDALVNRVVVLPTIAFARGLWAIVDRWVVDGVVEGSAVFARWTGGVASELQTGDTQWYGSAIVVGVALLLAVTVWLGR
jgi:NADH-quinone oxidoreductase subunit L